MVTTGRLYRRPSGPVDLQSAAVRRGVLAGALLLIVLNATFSVALAAPDMSVQPAADGTLLVVGNGWRPQQQLVV